MAKSKKTEEVIPEVIKSPVEDDDNVKHQSKETFSLTEAEALQKAGWKLLSISRTPEGKLYKFER